MSQASNPITVERLKFYADVPGGQKNKFFVFRINSIMDLENRLEYWMQRLYIRSAWYECIENGVSICNDRIDLVTFTDFHQVIFHK